jgi:Pilus formation protein N terminal region
MKIGFWSNLSVIAILGLLTPGALAGEPITIKTDSSLLMSVSAEPGTVVIGNPSIADVTMNGKQIFIHGRAFGETNLLILSTAGDQIANFDITVVENSANALTLYRGTLRNTFSCAPNCNPTMMVGDDGMEKVISQNISKNLFATGKVAAEASAPKSAPQ